MPEIPSTYSAVRRPTWTGILRSAKPGDLPIQLPTKFQMIVNVRTAKALGLTIPEAFLLRADE